MRRAATFAALAALAALGAAHAPAAAAAPRALQDLLGGQAAAAEDELPNRGYQLARTDGLVAYWWSRTDRVCAALTYGQGRVRDIDRADAGRCGQAGAGPSAGTVAAVGVGALIVGALAGAIAEKSDGRHHHDDDWRPGGFDGGGRPNGFDGGGGRPNGFDGGGRRPGGFDGGYSPWNGVVCYRREAACYEIGRFSSWWTFKEF